MFTCFWMNRVWVSTSTLCGTFVINWINECTFPKIDNNMNEQVMENLLMIPLTQIFWCSLVWKIAFFHVMKASTSEACFFRACIQLNNYLKINHRSHWTNRIHSLGRSSGLIWWVISALEQQWATKPLNTFISHADYRARFLVSMSFWYRFLLSFM